MFNFFRRSAPRPVSDAIARAVDAQGFSPALGDATRLRMVESNGRYSNRKVTFFRIFDPAVASQRMLDIQRYRDLDAFHNLILRSGHLETDGQIVVNRPIAVQEPEAAPRMRAGRLVAAIPADTEVAASPMATVGPASLETAEAEPTR